MARHGLPLLGQTIPDDSSKVGATVGNKGARTAIAPPVSTDGAHREMPLVAASFFDSGMLGDLHLMEYQTKVGRISSCVHL